jgi:hypothetical protein
LKSCGGENEKTCRSFEVFTETKKLDTRGIGTTSKHIALANDDQLPDLETLEKLSNLFEVSIDYLIGRQFYKKDLLR